MPLMHGNGCTWRGGYPSPWGDLLGEGGQVACKVDGNRIAVESEGTHLLFPRDTRPASVGVRGGQPEPSPLLGHPEQHPFKPILADGCIHRARTNTFENRVLCEHISALRELKFPLRQRDHVGRAAGILLLTRFRFHCDDVRGIRRLVEADCTVNAGVVPTDPPRLDLGSRKPRQLPVPILWPIFSLCTAVAGPRERSGFIAPGAHKLLRSPNMNRRGRIRPAPRSDTPAAGKLPTVIASPHRVKGSGAWSSSLSCSWDCLASCF